MPTTATRVERAHLGFTLALHRALVSAPTDTLCWSPYSVASALGLLTAGARGATRDELTALLLGDASGALDDQAAMLASASDLADPAAVLGVSNTLWARPGLPVRAEFTNEVLRWPGGTLREAPFDRDPAAARGLINADVSDATHGLIPELLGRGDITADTVATLVNALYLKAAWRNQFPERATDTQPFHGAHGVTPTPTMRLTKRLGYAATRGWQVVVLPAAGNVDAVVLLPDEDLATAESTMDGKALAAVLAAPTPRQVDLYLPRFRARSRSPLTDVLRGLGVRQAFEHTADLSGISEQPIEVSSVQHEAVLTVDEHGFEGAAATAVMMVMAMAVHSAPPVEVRVDRPFLFLVRHRASGAIYFLARVTTI